MYRQQNPFGQLADFLNVFQQPQGQPFSQGRPPFGPPGQVPGRPPFTPGGPGGFPGGGQIGQLPTPPSSSPDQFDQDFDGQLGDGPSILAVDPGSFYGCLRRLTYVRLTNGRRFWFYPIFIGRTSVAGYRWYPSYRQWFYTGFDTNRVDRFRCRL